MANVVIFDETTNAVKEYIRSVSTSKYSSRSDVVMNPDVSAFESVPRKYWIHDSGTIREMTQAEKDAFDQSQADAKLASDRARADKLDYTMEDVIVALVKRINDRLPANKITKAEIIQQLKDDKGL